MSDRILISGVQCDARIGVSKKERGSEQPLELDLELFFPPRRRTELEDAADYRAVIALAREIAQAEDRLLLEHLAEDMALLLKDAFSAQSVSVRIRKPGIVDKYRVGTIGVEVTR